MENLTNRVTTKEAARILGVTDGRVRQMILKGQLPAKRFGRALTLSRRDVEMLRLRKVGRPKKGRSAKPVVGNKLRKPHLKPLNEIIAESNVTPWTDADFERAAATAIVYKVPLITHNRKHFEGIAGLKVISEGE